MKRKFPIKDEIQIEEIPDTSQREAESKKLFLEGFQELKNIENQEKNDINMVIDYDKYDYERKSIYYNKIRHSALLENSDAIREYALFLKTDLYPEDDPIEWMKKAAKIDKNLYYDLGQMYKELGESDSAKSCYQEGKQDNENSMCHLKYVEIEMKEGLDVTSDLDLLKGCSNEQVKKEAHIVDAIGKLRGYRGDSSEIQFGKLIDQVSKGEGELSGKAIYLHSVLRHFGGIPEEVENGSKTFLSFADIYADSNPKPSNEESEPKEKPKKRVKQKNIIFTITQYDMGQGTTHRFEEYLKSNSDVRYLKEAADKLYEPAVAEYAMLLISRGKTEEAGQILQKFVSEKKCRHDHSRIQFRYAWARFLLESGKNENDKKKIEAALEIFKECADAGIANSCIDYFKTYIFLKRNNKILPFYYAKLAENLGITNALTILIESVSKE